MRRVAAVAGGVIVLGSLVAAAGVAASRLRAGESPRAAGAAFEPIEAAQIVPARELAWQPTADLMGTVVAMRSVVTRNELPGVVTFVGFQSGETVEAGQVLARLDETAERADLDAAAAAVRVAQANVAQVDAQIGLAEAELSRLTDAGPRAVAEVDLDRARTRLETARADRGRWLAEVDQARARVAQVEARLAKLTIRAPFRARAGLRSVHEGQYLAEGTEIVALQEVTDAIYLDFAIPQEYAPRVRAGTTVQATGELLGPEPVRIMVAAVDATVNNDTRNLRVRAVVDNPGGLLVPGMFVKVRVPIAEPGVFVAVPATAVRRAAYANFVFVVAPDDGDAALRAHQRIVTLGPTVDDEVLVLDGLRAGERVAAGGSFKLHDGVKVMAAPPAGGARGRASEEHAPAGAARAAGAGES